MAAKVPYQLDVEVDTWFRARAERLASERGVKEVKLAQVLREIPAIVDAAEQLGIKPAQLQPQAQA
jgi:hypothetical protein